MNDIDVVETLDEDTARMIKARLEKSSGQSLVTKCKEEDLDNDDDNERIIANNNAGSFDSNGDDMIII